MSDALRPIIIKKIKKVEGGHHGGAWKVAYADFVTAMMAFFLLMWLLNATTEEQRSGIADYFDPRIPISANSSGGTGMFKGDSVFAQETLARNGLGGSGKNGALGRDVDQRHEISESEEDVFSAGQKKAEKLGSKKDLYELSGFEKDKSKTTQINKEKMTQKEIQQEISRSLKAVGGQELEKHLFFKMTDEGLRIDIVDGDKPMFLLGSDKLSPNMEKIMGIVGNVLSQLVNDIAITGHTDSEPLAGKANYTNWELSSDRANAARRTLLETGIHPDRIRRIEGRADRQPLLVNDPKNAKNRRIALILLNQPQSSIKKVTKKSKENTAIKNQITIPDPLSF
jgi:chemotaxis protein MotB